MPGYHLILSIIPIRQPFLYSPTKKIPQISCGKSIVGGWHFCLMSSQAADLAMAAAFFTFGDTARQSYKRMIDCLTDAENYLAAKGIALPT